MSDVSDLFDITSTLINIVNNPGFDTGAGYAVPEIYDNVISGFETLRNGLDDIESIIEQLTDVGIALSDIGTGLTNESSARSESDDLLQTNINLLTQRIDNLLYDPIPDSEVLNGSRLYLTEFVEVFSTDQIDGLNQKFAFFTNALSGKLSDLSVGAGTGLTIDKSNPAFPIIKDNRPLWPNIQNKPSTFPPNTHGHAIADTIGLQSALDARIPLSQKGSVSGVASLDGSGKIPASQLPVYEPALQIVNTIAQRNALTPTVNLPVYVKDATGDPTVTTGGAFYLYELATLTWIKLSEMESMEIVQSWANVTGKPTVFTADLSTPLTGLSTATGGAVTATDSILVGFGRIQNVLNNIATTIRGTVLTGLSTATGGAVTATDSILVGFGKIQNVLNNIATTIRGTVLTGLSTATGGNITATDTLLVALGKLQNQITNASSASVPVGTVIESARATPPTGFLDCDGSAVSRTTYSALFSAIGTVFGVGDGSTTFNLPDRRGNVGRGVGTSVGYATNVTIALGEKTDDALQGHTHPQTAGQPGAGVTAAGGSYADGDSSGSSGLNTGSNSGRQASETRVKSLGMKYYIKF
ncbi:MAG: phage tail protein [Leptospira sp.]|nr:phage tail protein [Leptospira sp.]